MNKYVDIQSLNFRSEPRVASSTRIGVLHLGQLVDVQGDADGSFVKASAEIEGNMKDGFVSNKYLRESVSVEREALIHEVITEWERFKFGLGKEYREPYSSYVGEMWRAIELCLDGSDRGIPWSAAAISFMIRNAGKAKPNSNYANFLFHSRHAVYVNDAIVRQQKKDTSAPFWGFDLLEHPPQLGDIVCRWRKRKIDFDHASQHNNFSSHCDIIIRIKSDSVIAIGGNVGHSVKRTEYEKTPAGFLDDSKKVYAVLANRH